MKNTKPKKSRSELIYGRLPAINALSQSKVKAVYLQAGFKDEKILGEIQKAKLTPKFLNLNALNDMVRGGNHQGIVVEVAPHEYSSLDEIIVSAKKSEHPLILILDEIEDPHNFGAILRSCDAFGVNGVIIKSRNQVPLNMTVAKVSTGAIEYVKVAEVANIVSAINKLKDNGFWIYTADGSGKDDYQKLDYSGPVALVVGSEGHGASRLVMENSDFIIKIPMKGHVNSLNVSVSVGILLSRIVNK
ncbi:MAG: 23S rRNA (guanosine(2251)-2'-O)-methyltransferase RlmB [Firmicutes bacterium]|nr:23S rRNA (guanosine(2251)-2'-O)-methyltransferase RlmB [Candidatus Fiminaster equi]